MKVLIIKPSSLGDVIHSLRVVNQIKVIVPDMSIHWVIKKGLEEIISKCGLVDKVLIFNRGKGLGSYLRLIKSIRSENYDYVIDLQGLLRSGLLAATTKAVHKIGRADGREFSTFFYRKIGYSKPSKNIHAIEILKEFLKVFKVNDFDQDLPLTFSSEAKNEFNLTHKAVILFPESRRKEKEWPFFKELADKLKSEFELNVYISGVKRTKNFHGHSDLRGKVSLGHLPFLIKSASLVISNDSAPLHIASAQDIKVIGLFGPTSAKKYGPYPQNRKSAVAIRSNTANIGDISIEQVLNEINLLLEKD